MAVSRILSGMIIYLSDIPEDLFRTGCPSSVLSCTAWGFSCRANYSARGELLPRLFTLACAFLQRTGGLFSVILSVNAHFHERRPRILRGMLPYGVRTFLQRIPLRRNSPAIICHRRHSSTSQSHCIRRADQGFDRPISTSARCEPSFDNRKRNGHALLLSTW
jgi:hypothetical protein